MTEAKETTVDVHVGDITELEVDAIVNAANNHLWMGAGVAGAILRKGGARIQTEAVAQGPIQIGDAVVTTGGDLKARHVIHAAVMGQDLTTDADKIARATRSTLMRAREIEARRLALPAFGTGVGGFPMEQSARAMATAIREYLDEHPDAFDEVLLAVLDQSAAQTFQRLIHGSGN